MKNQLSELLVKLRGREPMRNAASRIGLSPTYLGILEKGIDPRSGNMVKPSAETLQKLAGAYNYPYERLMELAGYLDPARAGTGGGGGNPSPVELETILRESNIMFDGVILDDEDKEDIIQLARVASRAIIKRKGRIK